MKPWFEGFDIDKARTDYNSHKRCDPEYVDFALSHYTLVHSKPIALYMYENGIKQPTCSWRDCGVPLGISVRRLNSNKGRCITHAHSSYDNNFTYAEFIQRFHGKYDEWYGTKGTHDHIDVNCDIHGKYSQVLLSAINGRVCQRCHISNNFAGPKITGEEYIKIFRKIHGDKYDYSNSIFGLCDEKIEIVCPIHGLFKQASNLHGAGHGCQRCAADITSVRQAHPDAKARNRALAISNLVHTSNKKISKFENSFLVYLQESGIEYIHQYVLDSQVGPWSFDFYLPNRNLLVETDGEYFHTSREQNNRDIMKNRYAYERGYSILRISDLDPRFDLVHAGDVTIRNHTSTVMASRSDKLWTRGKK